MIDPNDVTIRRGSPDEVERVGPLWVEVHRHHAAVMPEVAEYVSDAETWAVRSALYRELLAKPDTVFLLAEAGSELVGYGLAHVLVAAETWLADTWRTPARVGEIESLAVTAARRGQGIGGRLLDELERALRDDGIDDLVIGVLPGNAGAVRLYTARGYRPTWSYLSRLTGRP